LASGGTECYVQLPDGGKVWFHANISTTVSGTTYTSNYTFTLKGIIDPYGQTTTVTSSGSTVTITETAGRTIQIITRTITNTADDAVHVQRRRENHPTCTAASTLVVHAKTGNSYNSRTETRGDGPSRTFTYNGYRLKTVTDFKGVVATQNYDTNYYLQSVVDR